MLSSCVWINNFLILLYQQRFFKTQKSRYNLNYSQTLIGGKTRFLNRLSETPTMCCFTIPMTHAHLPLTDRLKLCLASGLSRLFLQCLLFSSPCSAGRKFRNFKMSNLTKIIWLIRLTVSSLSKNLVRLSFDQQKKIPTNCSLFTKNVNVLSLVKFCTIIVNRDIKIKYS